MNVTKVLQTNYEFFEKWNGTKACACLDTKKAGIYLSCFDVFIEEISITRMLVQALFND